MSSPEPNHDPHAMEAVWRRQLTEATAIRWKRRLRSRIPSSPRCKMCAAPFAGIGGLVMPFFNHGPWTKNPKYCTGCFSTLRANHGGAEIECSLLFADVRGSTTLAERMSPRDFTALMGRFYDTAVSLLVEEGGVVDKFVGDEIIGIFIPALATERHAEHAVRSARALLRGTGHGTGGDPWVPIGIGVNTGVAYVGAIGHGMDTELTAMGDVVNTTARLSSVARAGEILVPVAASAKAGVDVEGRPRRSLELKGKSDAVEVVVLAA